MHSRALLLFIAGSAAIPVDLSGKQGLTALAAPDPKDNYVEAKTKKGKGGGCLHPTKKKMLGGAWKTGGKNPTPEKCMGICDGLVGCTGFGVKQGPKNGCYIYKNKGIATRPKGNHGNRCFLRKSPAAKAKEIAMIDNAEVKTQLNIDKMSQSQKADHVPVFGYTEILTSEATFLKAGGCEDADDTALEVYCVAGECPEDKYANWKYDWGIDHVWNKYKDDPTPETLENVGKECRKNCEDLWDGTNPDGTLASDLGSFKRSPETCTGFDLDKVNRKCNLFVKVIGMELDGTSVGTGKACYRRNGDWEGDE